jgi:hypothetical protein
LFFSKDFQGGECTDLGLPKLNRRHRKSKALTELGESARAMKKGISCLGNCIGRTNEELEAAQLFYVFLSENMS